MRLLNVRSLKLQEFTGRSIPRYCILSHRWGEEEVSYKEFRKGLNKDGEGYRKILDFCQFVKTFPAHIDFSLLYDTEVTVDWAWIDTCCIDKRSSAELSEAINSMYQWYANACECFVYMQDVKAGLVKDKPLPQEFHSSSWFTRGWTLQELLAPTLVVFCNASWDVLGHTSAAFGYSSEQKHYRASLQREVSAITKIPQDYLERRSPLKTASIAQRMSWASHRQTTRIEDEAYCLLGIFGVNMPLIYGGSEGQNAFLRLQEEIIKRSTDQSIFTWKASSDYPPWAPIFASSPKCFRICKYGEDPEEYVPLFSDRPYTTTNNGLEMRTTLATCSSNGAFYFLTLRDRQYSDEIRILLKRHHSQFYYRFNERYKNEDLFGGSTEGREEQLIYLATGVEMVDASDV